jgi:hypothetical protein
MTLLIPLNVDHVMEQEKKDIKNEKSS